MITRRALLLSGLAAPASAQGFYEDWPFLADDRTDLFTPIGTRRIDIASGVAHTDDTPFNHPVIAIMTGARHIYVEHSSHLPPIRIGPVSMIALYFEQAIARTDGAGPLIVQDHGQFDSWPLGAGTGLLLGVGRMEEDDGTWSRIMLNILLMPDDTLYMVKSFHPLAEGRERDGSYFAYRLEPSA